MSSALIVIDVQNDFCPGGALSLPEGDQIIPAIDDCLAYAKAQQWLVIASRDWHPKEHCSFTAQGGPWPEHCVQGSEGAAFYPALQLPANAVVVNKAFEVDQETYSALSGVVDATQQPVKDFLKQQGVDDIFVCGLALDYCVFATANEACQAGYRVHVVLPACRGIDSMRCKQCLMNLRQMGVLIEEAFPAVRGEIRQ